MADDSEKEGSLTPQLSQLSMEESVEVESETISIPNNYESDYENEENGSQIYVPRNEIFITPSKEIATSFQNLLPGFSENRNEEKVEMKSFPDKHKSTEEKQEGDIVVSKRSNTSTSSERGECDEVSKFSSYSSPRSNNPQNVPRDQFSTRMSLSLSHNMENNSTRSSKSSSETLDRTHLTRMIRRQCYVAYRSPTLSSSIVEISPLKDERNTTQLLPFGDELEVGSKSHIRQRMQSAKSLRSTTRQCLSQIHPLPDKYTIHTNQKRRDVSSKDDRSQSSKTVEKTELNLSSFQTFPSPHNLAQQQRISSSQKGSESDKVFNPPKQRKSIYSGQHIRNTLQTDKRLRRIERDTVRLHERIVSAKPRRAKFTPFIYNPLDPYGDFKWIEASLKARNQAHVSCTRPTACGVCDPNIDFQLDQLILPSRQFSSPQIRRKKVERSLSLVK